MLRPGFPQQTGTEFARTKEAQAAIMRAKQDAGKLALHTDKADRGSNAYGADRNHVEQQLPKTKSRRRNEASCPQIDDLGRRLDAGGYEYMLYGRQDYDDHYARVQRHLQGRSMALLDIDNSQAGRFTPR